MRIVTQHQGLGTDGLHRVRGLLANIRGWALRLHRVRGLLANIRGWALRLHRVRGL